MQTNLDRVDCMYLISEERFRRFLQLIEELDYFTLVLPFRKDSFQRSIIILDIWYLISTREQDLIENPENTMIYPYRHRILKMVKAYQIKRYIQLALYENERAAFVCAIYLYIELEGFILNKINANPELANEYASLQKYYTKSIRPYYDLKYQDVENYPRELAYLQNKLASELNIIFKNYEIPLNWVLDNALIEAEKIYEAVFGLINDWGGRVP